MAYRETLLECLDYTIPSHDLPIIVDDMSLAFHLGIRNKTLWYLIRGVQIPAGNSASLYQEGSILKRGKAGKAGKRRLIHIPDPRLKRVQKALDVRIVQKIPVGAHVRAYEQGRVPADTARMCENAGVLLSMDLKDFFGTTRRAWIRKMFLEYGYSRHIASLMAQLCCCTVEKSYVDVATNTTTHTLKSFMPQGTCVSPAVSNRVADLRFDQQILAIAADRGWQYLRYSDNLYLTHPKVLSREAVNTFKETIIKLINAAGWRVHKIRVTPKWRRQEVLGLVVNEHANIRSTEYRALRALIHNCLVDGFDSQVELAQKRINRKILTSESLVAHIRGKLSYVSQVLCESRKKRLAEEFEIALEAERIRKEAQWREEDVVDKSNATKAAESSRKKPFLGIKV